MDMLPENSMSRLLTLITPFNFEEIKGKVSKDTGKEVISRALKLVRDLGRRELVVLPEILPHERFSEVLTYFDIRCLEAKKESLKANKDSLVPVAFPGILYESFEGDLVYRDFFIPVIELLTVRALIWLLREVGFCYAVIVCSSWLEDVISEKGNSELNLEGIRVGCSARVGDLRLIVLELESCPSCASALRESAEKSRTSDVDLLVHILSRFSQMHCIGGSGNLSCLFLNKPSDFVVISSPLSLNPETISDDVLEKEVFDLSRVKKVGMRQVAPVFVMGSDLESGESLQDILEKLDREISEERDEDRKVRRRSRREDLEKLFKQALIEIDRKKGTLESPAIRKLDILVTMKRKKGIGVAVILDEVPGSEIFIPNQDIAIIRFNLRKYSPEEVILIALMLLSEFRRFPWKKNVSVNDVRGILNRFFSEFGRNLKSGDLYEVLQFGRKVLRGILESEFSEAELCRGQAGVRKKLNRR